MIPVTTMNESGELNYQVFNDNLTPVEQINRKLLAVLAYSQQKLVNDRDAFSRKVDEVEYTDEQIKTINEAASALVDAVKAAVDTFAATL